jgi:conjugative transfer signal peptidase TraF
MDAANVTHRTTLWATGAAAVWALSWPSIPTHIRLVYNPTTSAPQGWYVVEPQRELRVDDYVLAHLPTDAAALANDRHYLPISVPILKRIGAVGHQVVCTLDGNILIDNRVVARALVHDGAGRKLDAWNGCRALAVDEIFLLSEANPTSFDSRYFGPILRAHVIGKARPLWTW